MMEKLLLLRLTWAHQFDFQTDSGEVSTKEQVIDEPLNVDGTTYHITAVSMGNPHAIVYMDDLKDLDIEKIGPKFENHIAFPDRINTEFVKVIDRHTLQMRVWERGSGETLACGTGACAVAVASTLNGLVDEDQPVTVKLLGVICRFSGIVRKISFT